MQIMEVISHPAKVCGLSWTYADTKKSARVSGTV